MNKRQWLKVHESRENKLTDALASYFRLQAKRIADALLEEKFIGRFLIPHIFNAQAEHDLLIDTIRRRVVYVMAFAANMTLQAAKRRDDRKQGEFDFGDSLISPAFEIPETVLVAVRRAFEELSQQAYWQAIQTTTANRLEAIILDGVQQGANSTRIGRVIRHELGGHNARKRAARIARTEVTAAMNVGHQEAGAELQREGFVVRKQWSTTRDGDRRSDHELMEGVTVGNSEDFNLAGHRCPYPGWHGLPASQRANCRCSTFTRILD